MRNAVFLLAALYAIFFLVAFNNTSTSHMDAAGRSMAMGFLVVGAMIAGALTVPALILAALDKAPKWALGLALAPMAVVILAIGSGAL
jgi:hypothetical protein